MNGHFESKPNRRMPNGTYGGVRGKGAKAKTLAPRPTRFYSSVGIYGLIIQLFFVFDLALLLPRERY